jgi:hypothetical protein
MDLKRSVKKRFNKIFNITEVVKNTKFVKNVYQSNYQKNVLLAYIASPFLIENDFTHQNYVTSHLISKNFSDLGFNVDVIDHYNKDIAINYEEYDCIFGFGHVFEQSFYQLRQPIHRILFVTGAHEDLQNEMSLQSVKDFFGLSNIWLPQEAKVLQSGTYYGMYASNAVIILAQGFVYDDFRARFKGRLYNLNNNILGAFSKFAAKTISARNNNFLFLSGAKQITKGLHLTMEVVKKRKDLNFYVVLPVMDQILEDYYREVLYQSPNVFFYKNIRMDSDQMKQIIENCTYSISPSYIDGLPGGTIEPMSAGLIPIASKYCGFEQKEFIFELEELSVENLNFLIDKVLALTDEEYLSFSKAVKEYTCSNFSEAAVKESLTQILDQEVKLINA